MHSRTITRLAARLVALLLALSGTTFLSLAAAETAVAKDANCTDFNSQAAAQAYFLNHGGPNSDPDGLDADGDGVACETNSCPCNYGTGGGGGGGTPGTGGGTKKPHTINLRGQEIGNTGRFITVGKVPTYRGKFQIQRRLKNQSFKFYKQTRAKLPDGRVRVGIAGPIGACFQAVVPATPKYRLTTKKIGCIVKE